MFYENQPRSSTNSFSNGASLTISEWRQLKRISLNALGKKQSPLQRRKKKNLGTELTTWCVCTDTRLGHSFLFFPFSLHVDGYCIDFSLQKREKKASMDTIFISLLYHPCGCLRGGDTSLHCTKSMCPHVGQTLHNQLDRNPFRDSQIGESTFGSLSAAEHATYACRIRCTYHGWHSGSTITNRTAEKEMLMALEKISNKGIIGAAGIPESDKGSAVS